MGVSEGLSGEGRGVGVEWGCSRSAGHDLQGTPGGLVLPCRGVPWAPCRLVASEWLSDANNQPRHCTALLRPTLLFL